MGPVVYDLLSLEQVWSLDCEEERSFNAFAVADSDEDTIRIPHIDDDDDDDNDHDNGEGWIAVSCISNKIGGSSNHHLHHSSTQLDHNYVHIDKETDTESVSISPTDNHSNKHHRTPSSVDACVAQASTTTTTTTSTHSTIYIFDVHHSTPIVVYDQLPSTPTSLMFFSEADTVSSSMTNGLVMITSSKEVLHLCVAAVARSHRRYSITDSLMVAKKTDDAIIALDNHHHLNDAVDSSTVPYSSGKVGAKVAKVLNQSITDPLPISGSTYGPSSSYSSLSGNHFSSSAASMNNRLNKVIHDKVMGHIYLSPSTHHNYRFNFIDPLFYLSPSIFICYHILMLIDLSLLPMPCQMLRSLFLYILSSYMLSSYILSSSILSSFMLSSFMLSSYILSSSYIVSSYILSSCILSLYILSSYMLSSYIHTYYHHSCFHHSCYHHTYYNHQACYHHILSSYMLSLCTIIIHAIIVHAIIIHHNYHHTFYYDAYILSYIHTIIHTYYHHTYYHL